MINWVQIVRVGAGALIGAGYWLLEVGTLIVLRVREAGKWLWQQIAGYPGQ